MGNKVLSKTNCTKLNTIVSFGKVNILHAIFNIIMILSL